MTRTITPAEIKPGMTIRWTHNKVTYECPVMDRDGTDEDGGVLCHVSDMHSEYVDAEAGEVTVLAEPHPEEPTAFGARVVADGMLFVRADDDANPWRHLRTAMWVNWRDLCALGEVTVIDADPSWTLPAQVKVEVPAVPERIEEWPEDDEHLRAYQWRDRDGDLWWSVSNSRNPWVVGFADRTGTFHPYPKRGPWTRVADA